MKKTMILAVLCVTMMGLTGCNGGNNAAQQEEKPATEVQTTVENESAADSGESAETQTTAVETDQENVETTEETEAAAAETEATAAEIEALKGILSDIQQRVEIGTAGSYLKAVVVTVPMMDWSMETSLDADTIKQTVNDYVSSLDEADAENFHEQMSFVDEIYQDLLTEDQEELLESAGCTDTAYPWSTEPIPQIEAIMEAMGLR